MPLHAAGMGVVSVFVIFGWMRRFTVLGVKLDECQTCGQVCEHVVGRKTNWGHVFWIPTLFLGFAHGMVCTACSAWTPLPWRTVRAAMKTGVLHLDRSRPHASAALAAGRASDGVDATTADASLVPSRAMFDRLLVNPKRGPWDLYLKAWPVLVALLMVIGTVAPRTSASSPGVGTTTGASTTWTQPDVGPAHTCWQAADGSITGCRLADGSLMGSTSPWTMTCYFTEPLPPTTTSLSCADN